SRLVEQARQGNAGAFGQLVQRYQDVAFRVAYLIAGDAHDAEDIAQDAFVKAYAALGRFRVEAPFRPWLLQIVANEARNRRRSAGRRAHLAVRAAAEQPDAASGDAAPSPEMAALAAEQRRLLMDAVNGLRADDRQAIAYRYFLDLSEAEMADALGCARGTVKSRLSRALARLREQLAPLGVARG
ncbi:MAG TPA: sigma-70 family RNA polymerase sigma factor, partial [Chloroflexota bacterium]|nr:sigma-70 family RNA polymerase sigma factor [Chloroflexota bacterium]